MKNQSPRQDSGARTDINAHIANAPSADSELILPHSLRATVPRAPPIDITEITKRNQMSHVMLASPTRKLIPRRTLVIALPKPIENSTHNPHVTAISVNSKTTKNLFT
jgi:hypothetical protein